MDNIIKVPIKEINIGDRLREDMGDIKGLSESISKYGLLHPIILDDNSNLVAGGRRLAACKLLEYTHIEAINKGSLSEKELREIELEENLRRKDLTEYEKSKNMLELAKLKVEIKEEKTDKELRPNFGQKQNMENVRPEKVVEVRPVSERQMAKELGVPKTTIHDAKKHVEAVEKYPELKVMPKVQAIETAKKLDTAPVDKSEAK
jgi:ParB-like chromosome segregation protein Spo0J